MSTEEKKKQESKKLLLHNWHILVSWNEKVIMSSCSRKPKIFLYVAAAIETTPWKAKLLKKLGRKSFYVKEEF